MHYRRNAKRRRRGEFYLRPTAKKNLPQLWQDFIRQTKNVVNRAKNAEQAIQGIKVEDFSIGLHNRVFTLADQVTEIVSNATFCFLPMPRAFHGQPDIVEIFDDSTWRAELCLEAASFIQSILDRDPEFSDSLAFRLDYELGRIQEHLPPLAKNLPLLYAAAKFYQVNITPITKIGPIDVYLEEVEGILSEDVIDIGVKFILRAIELVYDRYKDLGIPDYALKGPLFIQVGLPPVTHAGLHDARSSLIDVTLLTFNKDQTQWTKHQLIDDLLRGFKDPEEHRKTFTLAHELAHRIYYFGLTPRARQFWRDLYETTTLSNHQLGYILYSCMVASAWHPARGLAAQNKAEDFKKELTQKEIEKCNIITKNLKDVPSYDLIKRLRPLETYSLTKNFWPTEYARKNSSEAFADTLASELLPEYWSNKELMDIISFRGYSKNRDRYGNSPGASTLIRNILEGVRPFKPR